MQSNLKIYSLILSFVLFFTASDIYSQMMEEAYTIAGITVEGNETSDPETVIVLSGLRVGDKVTLPADNRLQSAIRNLWNRHQFSDVQIKVDRVSKVGVFLVIQVEEFPRISEFNISMNDELSDEEIINTTGKVRGDIVSQYDLYVIRKNIKAKYEEEGLAFAQVKTDLIPSDTAQYMMLRIEVNEGIEFYTSSVKFDGNEHFSDEKLADQFDDTHTKSWWQLWRSSKFDKKEYEADLELLRTFFKQEGYIDAQILSDSLVYDEDKETVDILVNVDEGEKVYVRSVNFDGNTVYHDRELLRRLDFKAGDVYDQVKFEMNLRQNEDQNDVTSLYMDHGFLMCQFKPEEVRVSPDSVDITINVFEGDRVKIRRVNIVGNTKTKDKVIRRELYTRPGEYFSRAAIIRSARALGVMQYFNMEKIRPDVKPVDNTSVDVEYNLEEQSTDTFNASIGYAGVYGLTGSLGMTFNNFSITEPLKGGAGQILNFNWEFGTSSNYRTFSIGFVEPWLNDEPTTVGFNIFDTHINYYYKLSRTGVAVNIGRRFRWPDDYFRGDWSIRVQQNNVGTSGTGYRTGEYSEISLQQRISRTSLDNMFFASSGSSFEINNVFAMGSIGIGDTDYLKSEIKYGFYNPLMQIDGMNRLVMYIGTEVGYLAGFKSDTTVSPIEMYYMGGNGLVGYGVTPLRGYDDRAIGATNGNRVMAKHTAELRLAVTLNPMPIYLYGFAEAGNVWQKLSQTDPFDLKRSAGIGVQMMIQPIGVMGFSYGYGFDPDNTGNKSGWKFLFHLGGR